MSDLEVHLLKLHHAAVVTRTHAGRILIKIEADMEETRTRDMKALRQEHSMYVFRAVVTVQSIYRLS